MIQSEQIKKMVAHITKRRQGVRDREVMDPAREWILGIAMAFCFVVIGGGVSYLYYQSTISLEITDIVTSTSVSPYNAAVVESAVAEFTKRQTLYNSIRQRSDASPVVIDTVPAAREEVDADNTETAATSSDTTDNNDDGASSAIENSEEEILPTLGF